METIARYVSLPKITVPGTGSRWGRFIWHFLQMVVAMELGMMVYHHLLWPLIAQTPYAPLTDAFPLLGYWSMVASMVLGMLVLMLLQRSPWSYCFQMTLAMVAPVAALTVLVLCYLIPSHILYGLGDPVMFVAMAAFMLYRPHYHHDAAHEHGAHQLTGGLEPGSTGHYEHEM